jgi:hypothetical protein
MHTVGPGIWQEKVKNVKNENSTSLDLEKTENHGK